MILSNHATGNNSHTKLLIQSNNANGSSVFTDISAVGNTITGYGGITHSTAQYKHGKSSIYFDGTDDYLSIPDSADWNFGGDMTVSLWAYPDASCTTGHHVLAAHNGYNSSPFGGWDFGFYNGTLRFQFFLSTGTVKYQISSAANLYIANAWQHFSAVKKGNVVRLFINGIKVAESSSFVSYDAADAVLTLGCMKMNGVMSVFLNGYLDGIKIDHRAIWVSNFTPPNRMF